MEPLAGCTQARKDSGILPSWREAIRHCLGVSANPVIGVIRPPIKEMSPSTGHEAHLVFGHRCSELLDLVPVLGLRLHIDSPSVRPDFRLRVQIEQDGL